MTAKAAPEVSANRAGRHRSVDPPLGQTAGAPARDDRVA